MPLGNAPLADLYPTRGLTLVRGEGSYLYARDGTRYLDLMTNYGANLLGHCHPGVVAALTSQLSRLTNLHGSFASDVRLRASTALLARLPMKDGALYWGNSGAEAIEAALKFAIAATGRRMFVAATGAFHGKTLGALAMTAPGKYRGLFDGVLVPARHVAYGSIDAMAASLGPEVGAVIVEPIQGEGGLVSPPDGYLRDLRALCDHRGVLLIVDEIQTGAGRTGTFTVSERYGIEPDILCLGKGIAGGLPVGITAVGQSVAERLTKGLHTSTFGGNPLVAAAVLAVLDVLDSAALAKVRAVGAWFADRLAASVGDPSMVCGSGLMLGVRVGDARDRILKLLQEHRVLAIPAGPDVVRFLPPLTATVEELRDGVAAWDLAQSRLER